MERVPDTAKKFAEAAIGYIDLVLQADKEAPLIGLDRLYLSNARLLMQKIIGGVP